MTLIWKRCCVNAECRYTKFRYPPTTNQPNNNDHTSVLSLKDEPPTKPTNQPNTTIKDRCLAYHYCYTKLGTSHGRSIYIQAMHIYPWEIPPQTNQPTNPTQQLRIGALHTATTTQNLAHLMADLYIYRQCAYTHGRWVYQHFMSLL